MSRNSEGLHVLSGAVAPAGAAARCVLCVDDEPVMLQALSRQLSLRYVVKTASSGEAGLKVLSDHPAVAVVVADMRMPGMDGATFLQRVRQAAPETVRILLTGNVDFTAAIATVNDAQIFRFLTKPCSQAALAEAVEAAATQHRLAADQRVLLEETLQGSIKILSDVLALTNPVSFGRAMRIKHHVSQLAQRLALAERWQVEVAAMLSQIGWITLPQETAEKIHAGLPLAEAEVAMVERLPTVVEQLLAHIPRLDVVRGIVASQRSAARRIDQGDAQARLIALGGEILRVADDFELLEKRGLEPARALGVMRGRTDQYDPRVLAALAACFEVTTQDEPVKEVALRSVRVGMVLAEDVRTSKGTLLVARGYEVTESFMERVRNIPAGSVCEPLRVTLPRSKTLA
jgi:CheY-like chemotaxis protein